MLLYLFFFASFVLPSDSNMESLWRTENERQILIKIQDINQILEKKVRERKLSLETQIKLNKKDLQNRENTDDILEALQSIGNLLDKGVSQSISMSLLTTLSNILESNNDNYIQDESTSDSAREISEEIVGLVEKLSWSAVINSLAGERETVLISENILIKAKKEKLQQLQLEFTDLTVTQKKDFHLENRFLPLNSRQSLYQKEVTYIYVSQDFLSSLAKEYPSSTPIIWTFIVFYINPFPILDPETQIISNKTKVSETMTGIWYYQDETRLSSPLQSGPLLSVNLQYENLFSDLQPPSFSIPAKCSQIGSEGNYSIWKDSFCSTESLISSVDQEQELLDNITCSCNSFVYYSASSSSGRNLVLGDDPVGSLPQLPTPVDTSDDSNPNYWWVIILGFLFLFFFLFIAHLVLNSKSFKENENEE